MSRKRITDIEKRLGMKVAPAVIHLRVPPRDFDDGMLRARARYPSVPILVIPPRCATVEEWVAEVKAYAAAHPRKSFPSMPTEEH